MGLLGALLFLGGIALIVIGIGAAAVNRAGPTTVGRGDKVVVTDGRLPSSALIIVGVLTFAIGIVLSAFIQIPAGYVGVVRQFGAVTGSTLDPGLHFVTPIVNSVDQLDTRVKAIRVEGYTAASKEQQDLFLDATLNYHVDPRAGAAHRPGPRAGLRGDDHPSRASSTSRSRSPTTTRPTIVLNSRDEIRTKATELLRAQLEPRGIIVDGISFENFSYSEAYNQAIEEKQAAQQQVETERQRLAQQEIIAQQRVATARGRGRGPDRTRPGRGRVQPARRRVADRRDPPEPLHREAGRRHQRDARAVRRRRADPRPRRTSCPARPPRRRRDRSRRTEFVAPDDDALEGLVIDALEALPIEFRDRLGSVAIVIEDEPSPAQLASVGARGLFGLYQGVPRTAYGADQVADPEQDHALPRAADALLPDAGGLRGRRDRHGLSRDRPPLRDQRRAASASCARPVSAPPVPCRR